MSHTDSSDAAMASTASSTAFVATLSAAALDPWTIQQAVEMCTGIEAFCPKYHCHVGLTGGVLYKPGPRKDCDILFYRVRTEEIDKDGLYHALLEFGLTDIVIQSDWLWKAKYVVIQSDLLWKAKYVSKAVDIFFPDESEDDLYSYGEDDSEQEPPEGGSDEPDEPDAVDPNAVDPNAVDPNAVVVKNADGNDAEHLGSSEVLD